MPVAPKSMQDMDQPASVPDPAAVREQLERLLAHPLFANSKRYPALLAYVVEQTLLGNAAELKERSIGIEVFGRSPSYDANADPVVRITAGEVRKRLSQYYYDSTHDGELVIELPIGSYVPVFHAPDQPAEAAPEPLRGRPALYSAAARQLPSRGTRNRSLALPLGRSAAFFVVLAGALRPRRRPALPPHAAGPSAFQHRPLLGARHLQRQPRHLLSWRAGQEPRHRFHQRLRSARQPARAGEALRPPALLRQPGPRRRHYPDPHRRALEIRHKTFRVVPASEASFAQLREGPIVLIGAFDNIWTLRVTQKLRFGFESKDGVATLVDRKSQKTTSWATAWDLPYEKLSRDYAIVARIHDSTTGQPVIIAAGISEEGTEAAGEILYNPVYLDSLLAKAPAGLGKEKHGSRDRDPGHPGPLRPAQRTRRRNLVAPLPKQLNLRDGFSSPAHAQKSVSDTGSPPAVIGS